MSDNRKRTSVYGEGKSRGVMLGIGVSSLIIVFVALTISIFSVLSLVTVRQDLESAKRMAKAQEEYYAADTAANRTLYRILNEDEIPSKVIVSKTDEGTQYSWSEIINDKQELSCRILALNTGGYKIIGWHTVSMTEFQAEESLPIWNGSNIPE